MNQRTPPRLFKNPVRFLAARRREDDRRATCHVLFEACEERIMLTVAPHATPPPTGSIGGVVCIDYSADGKFGAGDTALPGITIYIDKNNNGRADVAEQQSVTDANGQYSFTALRPGKYAVRQVVPEGFRQNSPPSTDKTKITLTTVANITDHNFLDEPTAGVWNNFGGDAQHTGLSGVATQPLEEIHWQTPVDLDPQIEYGSLFVHFGSPLFTGNNVMILPVKTGAEGGFQLEGRRASDGTLLWTVTSDYIMPDHVGTLSFSPCLTADNRVYFPTAGGTVSYFDNADEDGAKEVHQLAFYNIKKYTQNKADYDAHVFINTPLTADAAGNIFFGVETDGDAASRQQGGIARISNKGAGKFIAAAKAAGDATIGKTPQNSAPALSADGKLLYVAVNRVRGIDPGTAVIAPYYLLTLNSTSLAPVSRVSLIDPITEGFADVSDASTASPTVGPDGDVYFGVRESALENNGRGWLLHFNNTLTQTKTPGAFGWDTTASIVPASMVPSYQGSSAYLVMTKYNNYPGYGGDGVSKLAILDPNATQTDPVSGGTTMLEVLTVNGATHEDISPDFPNAVYEWCINTAAVDPATNSVIANSEDGKVYRWDLTTNSLTQVVTLTNGIGEAYTPTVVGPDGAIYAINRGVLFAVGRNTTLP